MGHKNKKFYYNQILDLYLFSKNILGAKCVKNRIFKKKVDFYDGYLRFKIADSSFDNYLIKLNDSFDKLWNDYHYRKLEYLFVEEEFNMSKKTHIFYCALISIALIINVLLMYFGLYNNSFIVFLALVILFIPLISYIVKIYLAKNKTRILNKKKQKLNDKMTYLRNNMIVILKASPYYAGEDLNEWLIDVDLIDESIPNTENKAEIIEFEVKIKRDLLKEDD